MNNKNNCITEKECRELRHDTKTVFTKELLRKEETIKELENCIVEMKIATVKNEDKIIGLQDSIFLQKGVNDDYKNLINNISKNMTDKKIFIKVIIAMFSIFISVISVLSGFQVRIVEGLASKVDMITRDVSDTKIEISEIKGLLTYLKENKIK